MTKRMFCANGRVDPKQHFMVSTAKWNQQHLVPLLSRGTYVSLIAPSQTGKTTRVTSLAKQLNNNGYLAIYLDMSTVLSTCISKRIPFFDAFIEMLILSNAKITEVYEMIDAKSWLELFRKDKAQWTHQKQVILLLDEIDTMQSFQTEERANFLTALRSMKQDRNGDHPLYALLSVLVITNYVGSVLDDTIGNSSFNIAHRLTAPYFSMAEVTELVKQYEDQEGILMDDNIKKAIYENTCGAQGLTVIYMCNFVELRSRIGYNPSYRDWLTFSFSHDFIRTIMEYSNYNKMVRLIQADTDSKRTLMEKYYTGKIISTIPPNLIISNALLSNGEYASPFIPQLLSVILYSPPHTLKYSISLTSSNKIDVAQLIKDTIRHMNPMEIATAPKMSTASCLPSIDTKGPKEVVYVSAFKKALDRLLSDYCIQLLPEYPVSGKSCDMVVMLRGEKIAIEHGAILSADPESTQRMSVKHQVKNQAEFYHTGLKADQTWVINWTTIANGTSNHQVEYYFPQSETVHTVYVYHDRIFHEIQVVTEEHVEIIILPEPVFTSNRLDSGEAHAKKPRIDGSPDRRHLNPTQQLGKAVVFKDAQGNLRPYYAVSFAKLSEYITEVFAGKHVHNVTYDHVKFGELAIKDESNFAFVPDDSFLTILWNEQ